jgi:hypothetical protein
MATKDLTIRIRAEFGGDGTKLAKVLEQIQAEIGETTENLEKMGSTASKAMDTIGFGAEAQLSRWQKLNNAIQGGTSWFANGADKMAKAMAPWNQAIELGGKAIRFFDAGLDAAAQKYPEHAKDIQELRNQFGGLKEDVMAAVGVMTVELLKPIRPLEEMERRVEALRRKMGHKSFFGGDNEFGQDFLRGDDEAGSVAGSLGSAFDGFTKSLKGGVDHWNTSGDSFVDSLTEGMKKTADATRKAREEAAAFNKELREQAAARSLLRTATVGEGRNLTDTAGKPIGFSTKGLGESADSISRDMFGNDAERATLDRVSKDHFNTKWFDDLNKFQAERASQKTFLESAFGSVDEINAHDLALQGLQITFGGLTTAVNSSMQAWISGSMSLGLAIKKGIGDALAGVASQMAIEGLKHSLFALGSLAFLDFAGAARHGAAAAGFGAGAVAAAVAARKLGASVNAEIAAQKAASGSASGGARDSQSQGGRSAGQGSSSSGGGERVVERIIVIGEHFYSESNRMRQLDAQRFVQAHVGQSFVEHS